MATKAPSEGDVFIVTVTVSAALVVAIVYSTNACEAASTKTVHTLPTESETGLVGRAEQHSPKAATRTSPAVTEELKLTETVAVVPEPVAL